MEVTEEQRIQVLRDIINYEGVRETFDEVVDIIRKFNGHNDDIPTKLIYSVISSENFVGATILFKGIVSDRIYREFGNSKLRDYFGTSIGWFGIDEGYLSLHISGGIKARQKVHDLEVN